jgi:Flp pilus assembly protein TadG
MIRDDRGMAAITIVLLLPLLLTTVAGVVQLGAVRVIAARVSSAADLATLAATDDQDAAALIATGELRLAADAASVARRYFALNLASVAAHLAVTPDEAAARADVALFTALPATDPVTGWGFDRPTVRIAASVPVRTPLFGALLQPVTVLNVRAASAPR